MSIILRFITVLFITIKMITSISSHKNMHFTDASIDDIAHYIASKGYIPNEKELSKMSLQKNIDNDSTYILSKLSDEELLKLLNEQPQMNEYNLNDIMRIAFNTRTGQNNKLQLPREHTQDKNSNYFGPSTMKRKRFRTVPNNEPPAYFKLNNKVVVPNNGYKDVNYLVLQKFKKMLNVYSKQKTDDYDDDDHDKKQLMFDTLIAQLKTLCCNKPKESESKVQYKTFVNKILPSILKNKINIPNHKPSSIDLIHYEDNNKFMFLIMNDKIKSTGSDELIAVDPETLNGNSSVLVLGPVTSSLTDDQLKFVMSRVSDELTKPEYVSLLQQLSDGVVTISNKKIIKDFAFGSETRRYIKPHRCNHQSKLAKVYGGPKWIICTGYLNLNKPSLYD